MTIEDSAPLALSLTVLPGVFAICHLPEGEGTPVWLPAAGFRASIYSPGELTIVCEQSYVPKGVKSEAGWRAIEVQGPLDFSLVGVLASLALPLAEAGVSIFALSTYATDYVLVQENSLEKALEALRGVGHAFLIR
ncbi:MAG: ACT domain-containing protein [Anaerolineales bacterium]|nr:MAG: ACT domain-containing protein [Anaerolineales bacterium]